ncbi:MAG: branched-chain amino acid ABC transporter permease [Actinomycetota bacterium]
MTTATSTVTPSSQASRWLRSNRGRIALAAFFAFVLIYSFTAMETDDFFITIIRGLAVGAITFLVVSGLSLILGLMDVLNLAHGELYMLGAYMGWTIYVRPDTFLDVVTPIALALSGMALLPLWRRIASQWPGGKWPRIIVPIVAIVAGLAIIVFLFAKFPLSIWDPEVFTAAPTNDALALDSSTQTIPPHAGFDGIAPLLGIIGMWLGGAVLGFGIAAAVERKAEVAAPKAERSSYVISGAVAAFGLIVFAVNNPLTEWWYGMGTTARFFIALLVTTVIAFGLGTFIEVVFIRPLYERLLYQIMMTLGLGFILLEAVRSVWGRPSFTMPKPAAFNGRGEGCPGQGFGGLFSGCGTIEVFGSRVRMYNEVFIILVGILVLVVITLILKRSRLGMTIRAGVQDSEMVEALGINVRRVFTITFGMGVALAALGGVVAGPALGLSTGMGASVLLLALIAMAIGGLTSFPGAAVGAVIVGVMQQLMIRFGSVGIPIPGLAEPFKPSPALVPVTVILLMVVVLLVLPNGLFGREE